MNLAHALFSLSKPSRYLGKEWNAIKKNPDSVKVKFALIFPDLYEIGMSSLGFRIIYSLINSLPWASAERFFAPNPDMEEFLRKNHLPIFSLENRIPLFNFDIIGFSLSYEMNYTNILNVLDLGKIPLKSEDRKNSHPLVIAGGPCVFNPEPVSDFIDLFLIGDGEEGILEIIEIYKEMKGDAREKILKRLSEIEGVYVPAQWKRESKGRFIIPVPVEGEKRLGKRVLKNINESCLPSPMVPFSEIVFDRVMVEIARGCPQRCRFCQALSIYSPYRIKDPKSVIKETLQLLELSGYEDVSLSALSVSDYPYIEKLLSHLTDILDKDKISISIPSLRPSGVREKILEEIKKIRKTGFTIAPEAGTERLRKVINKNISDDEIYRGVETLFFKGWRLIKLYFMIGLPSEEEEDVNGIVGMAKKILEIGEKFRKGNLEINLTLSPFVPKPHTPFQWCGMESVDSLKEKIKKIKESLSKFRAINIKAHEPEMSEIEGILSRGDQDLSILIEKVFRKGAKLESWKDFFRYQIWDALLTQEIKRKYLSAIPFEEALPWDFIDSGFPKNTLLKEFELSLKGINTESCLKRKCSECKDCIFLGKFEEKTKNIDIIRPSNYIGEKQKDLNFYRAYFSKIGNARYLSHLEMIKAIERAFRRAKIPVWITKGFHPHMQISFAPSLPLGVAGFEEICEFKSDYLIEEKDFLRALSRVLPEGLSFFRLEKIGKPSLSKDIKGFVYSINLESEEIGSSLLEKIEEDKLLETIKSMKDVENCVLIHEPRKIVFKMKYEPQKGGGSIRELAKIFSPQIFSLVERERIILHDE